MASPHSWCEAVIVFLICTTSQNEASLIARLMGPTWDPSGADRTQVGPMLAPWTLLSGIFCVSAEMRFDEKSFTEAPRYNRCVTVSAVAIVIVTHQWRQAWNASHWWRHTRHTCISITVASQSEAISSIEHRIDTYVKHILALIHEWHSPRL